MPPPTPIPAPTKTAPRPAPRPTPPAAPRATVPAPTRSKVPSLPTPAAAPKSSSFTDDLELIKKVMQLIDIDEITTLASKLRNYARANDWGSMAMAMCDHSAMLNNLKKISWL